LPADKTILDKISSTVNARLQSCILFGLLWCLLFILYYPAAKAGFVTDFTGWLDQVKNHSFWDYVNRTNFHVKSLYQFTQLVTYVFYKLFGIHAWLWHVLFISLHALNASLAFTFCARLLDGAGVAKSRLISCMGAILFCISPYMSEVIVWEPSFHFLQGLLMILLILVWVQQFAISGAKKYALLAGLIYFLSTFSLEVFYITPWLVLSLAVYYRFTLAEGKKVFNKVMRYFFAPLLLLFFIRLIVFRVLYGSWVSRIGTDTVTSINLASFGKPAKYLFHLILVGRFFPNDVKQGVYSICDSTVGVILFYAVIVSICAFIVVRFRKMNGAGKVASLLFVYVMITLALLVPIWFGDMLLVLFDRYIYVTAAFFYMLFAVLVSTIPRQNVRIVIMVVYALVNLRFAIMVSRYWGKSAKVIHGLLYNIPDAGNKTIILLNLPESLNGTAMIGSEKESEYKLMHNLLLPGRQISNNIYDALSYNMTTPDDGAHITVANDSTIHVTLNQWGTWWWYEGKGGHSYENSDYKLNLADPGHWYELTLKKPAQQYLLLYQNGSQWKTVDMAKRNTDQY